MDGDHLINQGYARGLGIKLVYELNLHATGGLLPDKTFWLDLSPEVGLARIAKNKGREVNRLDLESGSFHQKVYEGYQKVYSLYKNRIIRIDAENSLDTVFESIRKHL